MYKTSIPIKPGDTNPVNIGTVEEKGIHKQVATLVSQKIASTRVPLWVTGEAIAELPASFANSLSSSSKGVVAIPSGALSMIAVPYYKVPSSETFYPNVGQPVYTLGCVLLEEVSPDKFVPLIYCVPESAVGAMPNMVRVKDASGTVLHCIAKSDLSELAGSNAYPVVGHTHAKFFLSYSMNLSNAVITEFGIDLFFLDIHSGNMPQATPRNNIDYMTWRY